MKNKEEILAHLNLVGLHLRSIENALNDQANDLNSVGLNCNRIPEWLITVNNAQRDLSVAIEQIKSNN